MELRATALPGERRAVCVADQAAMPVAYTVTCDTVCIVAREAVRMCGKTLGYSCSDTAFLSREPGVSLTP